MLSHEILTLGLLPEKKCAWRTFVVGYSIVLFPLLFLLLSRLIWPDRMSIWEKYTVTEIIPRPDLFPEKSVIKPKPKMSKVLPTVKFETPRLIVPRQIKQPSVQEGKIEPPKIQPANFEAPKLHAASGAMLAKVIYTGSFGRLATPTVHAQIQKVQTGGFGDSNGLPGQDKEGAKLNAAKLGSFDLSEVAGTGHGTGGAKEIKDTIASAGSGKGIAQPVQGDGRRNGQGIQASGFATQQVATNTEKHNLDDNVALTSQVEIIFKPKPVYTDKARKLNLEGEVLLEVQFGTNGRSRVHGRQRPSRHFLMKLTRKRLLFVDDVRGIRETLCAILRRYGVYRRNCGDSGGSHGRDKKTRFRSAAVRLELI